MIFRGRVARQLALAFVLLAILALVLTFGSIALVNVSHTTLARVAARARIAALSARLRSESVSLTDLVRNYLPQSTAAADVRRRFDEQTRLLDDLVQQAIAAADVNDVEESLRISQVRQNLIAFTSQAARVLNSFDREGAFGHQTTLEFQLLTDNYQSPLLQVLREFEQLELTQVGVAQTQADRAIELVTGVLALISSVVVVAVVIMISVVIRRVARPLAELRAGVEDIRKGQLDHSVVITSRDEFGELASAFNDMTAEVRQARQQQEAYARTLEQQVADRTREVERRAQQISTGAEIGRVATRLLDANELIARVVELIRARYDYYYVGLFLIEPDGQHAVERYGLDRAGRVFGDKTFAWPVGGMSIVGQVSARGQAYIASDVSTDPWYAPHPALPETRSKMALPLRLGTRVVGVLSVESDRLNAFDQSDAAALQGLADQVAIALENARLYGELHTNYERLQALERLRDDLTHMIVHDLRTPLTSFITGLPLLGELGDLNEAQLRLLRRVLNGGDTLLGMINNLLDIAQTESGVLRLHYEDVTAAELLNVAADQVLLLVDDRQLRLERHVAADAPAFQADRDLVTRVLVNLLGNAIKFSPAASAIDVAARPAAEAGFIEFAVTDSGPGISREDFERIFEKFGQVESARQGHKASTGLGLTFCKLAVEAHGGRIWVESQPGHGSTFKFVLPVQPRASQTARPQNVT